MADKLIEEMGLEGRDFKTRAFRSDSVGDGTKLLFAIAWKGDEPENEGLFTEQIFIHLTRLLKGDIDYDDFAKRVATDAETFKAL